MQAADWADVLAAPLLAALLIAAIHGPMGREVLRRGIIFIDLAIAQVAGLCVVLIELFAHHPDWGVVQAVAMAGALAIALFFRWVEKVSPAEQEAVIGCSFILAASTVLLVLADHPHGGEKVQHILSGQLLFVSFDDVFSFLPVFGGAILLWFLVPRVRTGALFFVLFAVVVTASVQLVGVYVVFASLILPALAVNPVTARQDRAAIGAGGLAVALGIAAAAFADLPAGPVLVLAYALVTLLFRVAARR